MNNPGNYLQKITNCFTNIIVDSVFQRYCLICSETICTADEGHICNRCRKEIGRTPANTCERCGSELTDSASVCGQCILNPPPYIRHASYGLYQEKMRKMVLMFKLSGKENLRKDISGLYREVIGRNFENGFDLIVPVPPDPGRKKTFDPVSAIAEALSGFYGKPCIRKNLVKKKTTKKQSSLNYHRRIRNLNGAYRIREPGVFSGKRILLIDDVYTTGTTVKKCTALLGKYSREIYVVTLAISPNLFTER